MNTLYIIGCGKEKLSHKAPAAQLYCGPYFRASLAHARRFATAGNIFILSAQYGLLGLDQEIEPYDLFLGDLAPSARVDLACDVCSQIGRLFPRHELSPLRVVCLAGAKYVEILDHARKSTALEDTPIRTPLKSMGMFEARRWLGQGTFPIESVAELSAHPILDQSERLALHAAARAAAKWWATQLLLESPPGEGSLFADALADTICEVWGTQYDKSRGEWPEEIWFPMTYQNSPGGIISTALERIGFLPYKWWAREWWNRDGAQRRLTAYMRFSMARVTVRVEGQHQEQEQVIYQP